MVSTAMSDHAMHADPEKAEAFSDPPTLPTLAKEMGHTLAQTATAEPDSLHSPVEAVNTREDGTEYPTGLKLGLIALALCLSVFLVALGTFAPLI
jgi:hypothetical protein